jgi:DNA repair exonuclease SbcCD ATPase subunit
LIDEKNKLELSRDKNEVEMSSLRNKIKEKNNDLKKYNLNLKAIELNKNIDIEITNIKTKLQVLEYSKDDLITKIERVQNDEKNNSSEIVTKEKLIEIIKKEEGVEKIFKLYIELVGKKGISKLVLRSVLPIINSEAQRLLEDVCDFEIEIFMDDKNDVQFLIIKDGVTKLLKSGSGFERTAASLVLRCVLGKISTLPMPNFIAFDEVLGKVAPDNMEKLKTLFDKIKEMYEIVFLITHNELVKDWSDNIITVVKENNISKAVFN